MKILVFVVAVFTLALALGVALCANRLAVSSVIADFRALSDQYFAMKAKTPDIWQLKKLPADEKRLEQVVDVTERRILRLITENAKASFFASQIVKKYSNYVISVAIDERSSITSERFNSQIKRNGRGSVEITIVPQDLAEKMAVPSSVYWRSDWGLMISALHFPDTVLAGCIFYGLGHGIHRPVHPNTQHLTPGTKEYATEDVNMHTLEFEVLNSATSNEFGRTIKRIVAKHEAMMTEAFLSSVTLEDLKELDRVMGVESFGYQVSSIAFAQYMLALGFEHIDRYHGGDQNKKVELYQWLHQNLLLVGQIK